MQEDNFHSPKPRGYGSKREPAGPKEGLHADMGKLGSFDPSNINYICDTDVHHQYSFQEKHGLKLKHEDG